MYREENFMETCFFFFFGIFIRYEVIGQFLLPLVLHAFHVSSFKGFFADLTFSLKLAQEDARMVMKYRKYG